jgi:hypothetical protein
MTSAAASRMRAFRRRQRDGLILLVVSVPDVAITELLVRNRYMSRFAADAGDRAAVCAALELFLRDLSAAGVTPSRPTALFSDKLPA